MYSYNQCLSIGSHRVGHDWSDLACMHALEKEMATHSNVLAWRIPGMAEPGGLLSMGSHRVGHDWSDLACMHTLEKEMATHSSVLAWRIPGTGEPGGLPSMGSHRVRHDWSDLAAAAAADFSVHGVSQAKILKWVATSFSRESSWLRDWTCTGRWILYCWATRVKNWVWIREPAGRY